MKRFIASELWQKEWWQKLPPRLKTFYYYMISSCDSAGVWEPNFSLASFLIGETITESDMEQYNGNVIKLDCNKWWLNDFISFQYGTLSKDCKAHNPVFFSIKKYSLSIAYPKAIRSLQEEDKDKVKVKDKERDMDAVYLKHPLLKTLHDVPMLRGLTLEMWLKCIQNRHKFLNWTKAVKWVCDQAELEGNIKSPGKFVDTRLSYYEKDHLSECKQREEKASVRAKDLKEFIEYMSDKDIPQEHKTQNINDMKKQYGQDFINEAETEMLKK